LSPFNRLSSHRPYFFSYYLRKTFTETFFPLSCARRSPAVIFQGLFGYIIFTCLTLTLSLTLWLILLRTPSFFLNLPPELPIPPPAFPFTVSVNRYFFFPGFPRPWGWVLHISFSLALQHGQSVPFLSLAGGAVFFPLSLASF